MDINYPDMEPFTVTILSLAPKILPIEFEIAEGGELVLRRKQRLVQVYTDPGGVRTLALADITLL